VQAANASVAIKMHKVRRTTEYDAPMLPGGCHRADAKRPFFRRWLPRTLDCYWSDFRRTSNLSRRRPADSSSPDAFHVSCCRSRCARGTTSAASARTRARSP
jgi:hypothetical protein